MKKKVLPVEKVKEVKVDPRRVRLNELDKTPLTPAEFVEKQSLQGLVDEGKI